MKYAQFDSLVSGSLISIRQDSAGTLPANCMELADSDYDGMLAAKGVKWIVTNGVISSVPA